MLSVGFKVAVTNPSPWKRLASTVAITLATTMLATQAQAQQAAPSSSAPSTVPGYTMPSTHMWDMPSDGGEIYRIFVSFPATEMPADGYPVLYVLDGNATFAAFAEARRIQERYDVGKSIVVGVGYPTDKAYDTRRLNDYTPPMLNPPLREWNEQGVLREEREFTTRLTSGKVGKTSRLLVVVGGRDGDDDPYMAEAFANRMESLSGFGLRTRLRRYEEEGHMSVPARAVTDTLRFVF